MWNEQRIKCLSFCATLASVAVPEGTRCSSVKVRGIPGPRLLQAGNFCGKGNFCVKVASDYGANQELEKLGSDFSAPVETH